MQRHPRDQWQWKFIYPRLLVFKTYSRETLLRIRVMQDAKTLMNSCDLDTLRQHGILSKPANHRRRKWKRCERKQKRGKRAGIHARLKANPSRPAVPSLLLSNVRSLDNKLDELHLLKETHREWKDCRVFAFTETWLQDNIPDAAVQLEGMTAFWVDKHAATSGKSRGGGPVHLYQQRLVCKCHVSL